MNNKTKKILIITEKPSQQTSLLKSIDFNKHLENTEYKFYSTLMLTPYRFDYPKNKKYKEFPLVEDVKYTLKNFKRYERYKRHEYTSVDYENQKIKHDNWIANTSKEYFEQFDELILCPDPDHTGVYAAFLTLQQTLGLNWEESFENIYYFDMSRLDVDTLNNSSRRIFNHEDVLNIQNKKKYNKWNNQGKIKRYFEYNFNLNSMVFITETLSNIDIKVNGIVSKFLLMTFNGIYNNKLDITSESKLIRSMESYKGSCKYVNDTTIWSRGIGGPASRGIILQDLLDLGLIKKDNNDEWKLSKTDLGYKFFNLLNKKTFDPDLSFRLVNWMEKDFEEVKPLMNKYIISMFKAQKVKNKHFNKVLDKYLEKFIINDDI